MEYITVVWILGEHLALKFKLTLGEYFTAIFSIFSVPSNADLRFEQTLAKSCFLLIPILSILIYQVSLMATQLCLSQESLSSFIDQTKTIIITISVIGLAFILSFRQLHKSQRFGLSERKPISIMTTFFFVPFIYILCQNNSLDLDADAMHWVQYTIVLILMAYGLIIVCFNDVESNSLSCVLEELFSIFYLPIGIYWLSKGVIVLEHCNHLHHNALHLLIFCAVGLIWTLVPAALQLLLWTADLIYQLVLILPIYKTSSYQADARKSSCHGDGDSRENYVKSIEFGDVKEKICPICWEDFDEEEKILKREGCYHCYHVGCIKQWVLRDSRCPLCRGWINNKSIFQNVTNECVY